MSARPSVRLTRSYAAKAEDRGWFSRKNYIWLLIALAVGFFVRLNELASQSLWNDEGTSVALAQTSITAIVNAAARDIHPPLYYLLLSGWGNAAGWSEFAVRFLSVMAGVLVIAVTFRIAREFFDEDVAVIAAVLSALNAFQTYYAQETRMYIWVTLFGALSLWMMIIMFKPPRHGAPPLAQRIRRRSLAVVLYVVFTLAALCTNYYAFTLVLVQNLAFVVYLLWARRERRPRLGHAVGFWVGAQLLIALAYVPWLLFARASLTAWPGISEPMSLVEMGWRIASSFVVGAENLRGLETALVATYVLFFIGGLLPSRDLFRHSVWGIVTCALWALVPLAAMYIVSLSRPAFNPKFLLLATPGFLILVARGVSVFYPGLFLRERSPYPSLDVTPSQRLAGTLVGVGKLFMGALLAGGTILALQALYDDPRLQRDDYRGIMRYLNAVTTDRDAVIVNAPGQMDVVRYYYHGAAGLRALPVGRPLQVDATRAELVDLIQNHKRVYAIYWATEQADPEQFVERSLSEVAYKASDEWRGNVRLAQYGVEFLPRDFSARIPFGEDMFLRRFGIADEALAGGDIITLQLVWLAMQPPQANYQVFAHLLDAAGRIVAQHDAAPQNGFRPTAQWTLGEEVVDRVGILIPPGTPPGEYTLVVGLYRGDTGERLKLKDGTDGLTLGRLNVGKTPLGVDAVLAQYPLAADFDAIRLFGYNLERSRFARGEFIPLALFFHAREKPSTDVDFQVQLLDQGNNPVVSARLANGYPTSEWEADAAVRQAQNLQIPANTLPGEYRIVVTDGAHVADVARIMVQ